MDDCLVHSPTHEQQLPSVAGLLEILSCLQALCRELPVLVRAERFRLPCQVGQRLSNYPAHVVELLAAARWCIACEPSITTCWAPRRDLGHLAVTSSGGLLMSTWRDQGLPIRRDAPLRPPGARNPTDPLSRRGFADGDRPAAEAASRRHAQESQEAVSRSVWSDSSIQSLRLCRDSGGGSLARWATTRHAFPPVDSWNLRAGQRGAAAGHQADDSPVPSDDP